MDKTFGFIGFGKMANAVCKGIINSGFIKKESIYAYDINFEHLEECAKSLGINPVREEIDVLKNVDTLLIATKPFVVNDVIEKIKDNVGNKLVISILAGITTETYENSLKGARIVRVMPNTPAMVNEGMSVVCGGKTANNTDLEFVKELFSKLGKSIILEEDKINAVTAVSGSGPAFYYYIIDLIAKAGEKLGLSYETSLQLSAQTALGASKMILETKIPPKDLIKAVTTPNGTTAEGNKVLIESDIDEILFKTIKETNRRAFELGAKK